MSITVLMGMWVDEVTLMIAVATLLVALSVILGMHIERWWSARRTTDSTATDTASWTTLAVDAESDDDVPHASSMQVDEAERKTAKMEFPPKVIVCPTGAKFHKRRCKGVPADSKTRALTPCLTCWPEAKFLDSRSHKTE